MKSMSTGRHVASGLERPFPLLSQIFSAIPGHPTRTTSAEREAAAVRGLTETGRTFVPLVMC
ncbi:hypothetical protein ACNUDN_04654 [Mycobacterium sp. smrl_JER01]